MKDRIVFVKREMNQCEPSRTGSSSRTKNSILLDNVFSNRYYGFRKSPVERRISKKHFGHGCLSNNWYSMLHLNILLVTPSYSLGLMVLFIHVHSVKNVSFTNIFNLLHNKMSYFICRTSNISFWLFVIFNWTTS